MINGMQVFELAALPEWRETHRQERKWAHRVMHNRDQRFKVKLERAILIINGSMHVHPNTYKELKSAIDRSTNPCQPY